LRATAAFNIPHETSAEEEEEHKKKKVRKTGTEVYPEVLLVDSDDGERKDSMNSHPNAMVVNVKGHLDPYEITKIDVINDKSNSSHNSFSS
jgi:hypothetical protein